jgi:hypothetical protein
VLHELPMVFTSDGAPLAGTFVRDSVSLSVRERCVVVTGSWLTVKEQMALVDDARTDSGKYLYEWSFRAEALPGQGFGIDHFRKEFHLDSRKAQQDQRRHKRRQPVRSRRRSSFAAKFHEEISVSHLTHWRR